MRRRAVRPLLALSSTLAVVAAMACGSTKEDPAPAGAVVLAPGVTVLDAKQANDVTVLPGQLVFPKGTLSGPKVGDILVGDAGSAADSPNKWGFLRRVTAVREEAGKIVIDTTQAELTDVVQKGELSGTLTIPSLQPDAAGAVAEPSSAFKSALKGGGGATKLLDFSGKTLLSDKGSVEVAVGRTLGYEATVLLTTGTLDFTPTFDVGAKIEPSGFSLKGAIKEAHVVATGRLDAVAEIDASFKLTGAATGADVAALIAKKVFGKPTTTIADHKIKLPGLKPF